MAASSLAGDGSITYTWNKRNQLTAMSGTVTASFTYDGLGRRLSKTVGGVTTAYVYDRLNFVQEKNGTAPGATVASSVRAVSSVRGLLRHHLGLASVLASS